MARKKAETTTEKKPKEKKILTPADYGPFDILKLMFTDPVKFEEIPLKTLEKSYFITKLILLYKIFIINYLLLYILFI